MPAAGTDRPHPLAHLTVVLLVLGLLSACSGDEDEAPDEAGSGPGTSPAVGAYELTTRVTSSTIGQNPAGPESRETSTIYVTCWDQSCATLAQRGAADMWHAQTFRLAPDGDGYSSSRTRTGPCPTDEQEFEETFTIQWSRAADGTLAGSAQQELRGCEEDEVRTAEYELTGEPSEARLPYLQQGPALDLAATLNEYDESYRQVSEGFENCFEDDPDTVGLVQCKAGLYDPWISAIESLGEELAPYMSQAEGDCREALESVDGSPTTEELRAVVLAGQEAESAADAQQAEERDSAARDLALEMQSNLVRTATMCVPPQEYASLGEDGTMLIDSAGSLIPPLDD